MFEKEAEEWADKMYPCDGQAQRYLLMGAEFGYNKAIVEIKDAYEGNGNFSAWFENYLEGKNV